VAQQVRSGRAGSLHQCRSVPRISTAPTATHAAGCRDAFLSTIRPSRNPRLSYSERKANIVCASRWLPGPIIEIGSWCGLSTTAIAQGIRDSGERKSFHTYDLALTLDSIRPVDGDFWMAMMFLTEFAQKNCINETYCPY